MEDEIKHEFGGYNKRQCYGCLSIGRLLRPLQDLASTYVKITSNSEPDYLKSVLLCWQCVSLLKKVVLFQEQVKKADELLQTNQNFIYGPLTNLTSITLNETHQIIYIHEGTIQTNIEPINNETVINDIFDENSDNKDENINLKPQKHIKSRWAIKRAEQNKKPKFKVSTNFDKSFIKIQLSDEELHECIERERNSDEIKTKKFECNDCRVTFINRKKLEKHKRIHRHRKYKCDICKCHISTKNNMLLHLKEHFVYKCIVCQFICQRKLRFWHFNKEHKRVYECLKCRLRFGSRRVFYKHYKESHEKFICHHCGITFKMRYCIKDHIRKQHSPFECKPCSKTFARYNGLWLHNKLAHRPASPAYCTDCGTTYTDVYRLKWHLCNSVRHTQKNKLRIPCSACDKVFTKKIYMTDHYNLVHLKVFKYRCEPCDKNFVRNADLMKHKRKIHEGIQPPKNKICYICGRGFTTNKILHNHVRTHTGERARACPSPEHAAG